MIGALIGRLELDGNSSKREIVDLMVLWEEHKLSEDAEVALFQELIDLDWLRLLPASYLTRAKALYQSDLLMDSEGFTRTGKLADLDVAA